MELLLKSRRTNGGGPQKCHNEYGIYNFLVKKGISDKEKQYTIIKAFLESVGFKSELTGIKLKDAVSQSIQARWSKFSSFVNVYIKTHNQ